MRLLLIRHGQTPSNVAGRLDTRPPGPGLTELGSQQAAAVPAVLADERIEAVYASTAVRAQLTAAPLAAARSLPVTIRPGLREIAAGDWEMASDEASVHGYLGLIGRWMAGQLDERSPGPDGESGAQVLQRFDEVVAEIAGSGVAGAAVVAHGAVIRLWASVRAANLDERFGASHPLRNTGIVVMSGDPAGGWTAHSWSGAEIGVAGDPPVAEVPDDDPFDETIPVAGRP